jgi:hypothetical protein
MVFVVDRLFRLRLFKVKLLSRAVKWRRGAKDWRRRGRIIIGRVEHLRGRLPY